MGSCMAPLLTVLLTLAQTRLRLHVYACLPIRRPHAITLPALVGTPALTGTTHALIGPPAVVKTYSAHNALPLLLG